MTDQELDQMMRRALLDAAAQEAEALPQEPPELSPRHGRSMRAMLRDPLAWARSRRRPAQPIPQYQITALPEGYVETERTDALDAGNVTYKNSDGDMILLDYAYMQDGALHRIILNDTDTMSDIRVSGMPGKLILSAEEKNFNRILWIDAAQNLQFTITAAAEESVIIAMAESVSLYDPTK